MTVIDTVELTLSTPIPTALFPCRLVAYKLESYKLTFPDSWAAKDYEGTQLWPMR